MRAFAAGILLLGPLVPASAQDDILIYGTIKDYRSGIPLPDARLVIASEAGAPDTLPADTAGTYAVHVGYGHLWRLWYEAPGRVTKHVVVDGRGIPAEDREGGHGMDIEMSLFPAEPGKDYSMLEEPMSVARYVDSSGEIGWDMAMLEQMKSRIAAVQPDTSKELIAADPEEKVEHEPEPEIGLVGILLFLGIIAPLAVAIWWFLLRQKH